MARAPAWSREEFEVLLQHDSLAHDAFTDLLPQRSAGAIDVVREGIHAYHAGMNDSMLSQVQRQVLQQQSGNVVCPVCGTRF